MQVITGERVPIKIWSDDPDPNAVEQLRNVARLPFVVKWVAAMPDVHWGMGATVGSVIATQGAVVPSAVGVDIGCGMMAWNTGLRAADLKPHAGVLRAAIEARVPVGFNMHPSNTGFNSWVGWGQFGQLGLPIADLEKARRQMGTLGGGNHFIELCEDENGDTWVMLHSGSRGTGKNVADIHMRRAQDLCARYFVTLPDKDLAYLVEGTAEFEAYIKAVTWCQAYAWLNRETMMALIEDVLAGAGFLDTLDRVGDWTPGTRVVHCHHNYVEREHHYGQNVWLTRKGAVCARLGTMGIIPGSMGARSYIVEGLGNPESFHSCSHGAGRRMGRNEARKKFTVADLEAQTADVDCRKDDGVLDELPSAYKDIDVVMANQTDLVRPVHTLKQFLCIKG